MPASVQLKVLSQISPTLFHSPDVDDGVIAASLCDINILIAERCVGLATDGVAVFDHVFEERFVGSAMYGGNFSRQNGLHWQEVCVAIALCG